LLPAYEIRPEIDAGFSHVLSKAMSQKRDDRFAFASDMRRALSDGNYEGSGEQTLVTSGAPAYAAAPTVTTDKATRLVGDQTRRVTSPSFSSEAQTLVAGEATNVRTVTSGQAAVAPATTRANWKPIAAAVVLLILVGGGIAGFVAFRRQRAQQTAPQTVETQSSSQSSQPTEPVNNSVAPTTESKDPVEAARSNQAKTDKSKPEAPRTETQRNAQTNTDPKAQDPFKNFPPPEVFDPAHAADPNRARDRNQPGQPPPFDPFRPPGEQPRPRPLRPEVRVLPNGGRIIKNPDGSIIMIGPNGKTTTIPPPPDRRDKRKPNGNDNENRP
jgi:hypothetical protein